MGTLTATRKTPATFPLASPTQVGMIKYSANDFAVDGNGVLMLNPLPGNIGVSAVPGNLTISREPDVANRLNWDPSPGASLYIVRSKVNGGAKTIIATVPFSYFNDTSSPANSAPVYVEYFVTAANSSGESNEAFTSIG
ncbi:hypothetical protein [Hymenobacter glacieicola]|uniref:Fibronectin type-III domain-containing protein n=1 Tax=Hymenobacter glacieicola TaxID=1562124 RepID=A0ABQ1X5L3_9BACT|nr:hypothetical protein [Hymenobacter glacieicola]GGG60629.1 hypothetical protein GCM10011378_40810 [Hymenobacter glacieicola]